MKQLKLTTVFLIVICSLSAQNKVLQMNGADEEIFINSPISGDVDFTAEIWFTGMNGATPRIPLISWGPLVGSSTRFHLLSNNNKLTLIDDSYNAGQSYVRPFLFDIDDDNEWHHVVVRKEGQEVTVFLDNATPYAYDTGIAFPFNLSQNLYLGRTSSNDARDSWDGRIDEFRIWDYARSDAEIAETSTCELVGNEAGLVLYYDFENTIQFVGQDLIPDKTFPQNGGTMFNFSASGDDNLATEDIGLANTCGLDCEVFYTIQRTPCSDTYTFIPDTDTGVSYEWTVTGGGPAVDELFDGVFLTYTFDWRSIGDVPPYEVCLTVTYEDGCEASYCENFTFSEQQQEDAVYYEVISDPEDLTAQANSETCTAQLGTSAPSINVCNGSSVSNSYIRSDGRPISAPYEIGITTVTVQSQITSIAQLQPILFFSYEVTVADIEECKDPVTWQCGDAAVTCASPATPNGVVAAVKRTGDFTSSPYDTNLPLPTVLSWTVEEMGEVFGTTFDEDGNIYFTSSIIYGSIIAGPNGVNIYKVTSEGNLDLTFQANLPNEIGPLRNADSQASPGLGNICYDKYHNQLLVTNFEDGRIYRIDPSSGATIGTPFSPYDYIDDSPGYAPLGVRTWGINTYGTNANNVKVYYGSWNNDAHASNSIHNYVGAVTLDGAGDFMEDTNEPELIEIPFYDNSSFSHPISDIALSVDGVELYIAERSMKGDIGDYNGGPLWSAHDTRVMQFTSESGDWVQSDLVYGIGVFGDGNNSAGGLDLGFVNNDFSNCQGALWVMGDAIHFSPGDRLYGLQVFDPEEETVSASSWLFDLDEDLVQIDKIYLGDVEVYKCDVDCEVPSDCFTVVSSDITCNDDFTYELSLSIKNENDQIFDRILTFPQTAGTAISPSLTIDFGEGFPILSPGEVSEEISFTIRVQDFVSEEIEVCFDVIPQNPEGGDCCKDDFCITLPVCCEPEESKNTVVTASDVDDCCYDISVSNSCAEDYFSAIFAYSIIEGLDVSAYEGVNGWTAYDEGNGIVAFYMGDGEVIETIPVIEEIVTIGTICMDGVTSENVSEQYFQVDWMIIDEGGNAVPACSEDIPTECTPDPCNLIFNPVVTCDELGNYHLDFSMQISESDTEETHQVVIGVHDGLTVDQYSPQVFDDLLLQPGSLSSYSVDLFDVQPGDQFTFSVTLHDFDTPMEDGSFWCCYTGDQVTVNIPPCIIGEPGGGEPGLDPGTQLEPAEINSDRPVSYVIYPNPVREDFVVAFERETETPLGVELINMQGRKIMQESIPEGVDRYRLSLSENLPAVYFVRIKNERGLTIGYQKILKF